MELDKLDKKLSFQLTVRMSHARKAHKEDC